jgi:arylsulfatase A-like enzyme/thioredoxin-like negative regulator of GroEL
MSHRLAHLSLAILCLALAPLLLTSCGDRSPGPRNVVLVTLDTTRADRLGCYGHAAAVTPVLDSLAARGVVFERAFTSVPLTLAAHASILTGLYPTRHGVRDNGIFQLAESFQTVSEVFKDAGYQTGAFVSAFVLAKSFGTAQGFTTYDDRFYNERGAQQTSRAAARWIEKLDPARPFFLWLHYYDPHVPRQAPEPFCSMPGLDPYDQEVAAMDAGLGWFLARLRAKGIASRTDLVIVGDHGEGLGEHGEGEHGLFLYDATLHVPLLLVRHDGRWAGRRVADLATVQDVTPTLIALAGLQPPAILDGIDLQELARGRKTDGDRESYAETYFPETSFYHSHIFALRTLRWKYVSAPRPELYDLAADPGELSNVIEAQPQTAAGLSERLEQLRKGTTDASQAAHALETENLERLQSLGYLAGGQMAAEIAAGGEFVLPDPKDLGDLTEVFSRGAAAIDAGRLEEGRTCMLAVLERNPENVIARINLGKLYIRLKQPAAAVEQLEQAALLSPRSATAKKFLGMAYQAAQRHDEALATLRQIEDDPSQGITASLEIGRTQLLMGQAEEAQHTFRTLADRVGGSPAITRLAEQTASYIEAREALARRPGDEEARLALSAAAIALELPALAEGALRFRPSSPMVAARRHLALGSVAGVQGDDATALAEYELARPVLGHDPYLRTQLVGLYLGAGRVADALAMAEGLVREGKVTPATYYNQACALARLGRADEAFVALRRAVNAGYDNLRNLSADPDLESLRGDERFVEILDLAASLAE